MAAQRRAMPSNRRLMETVVFGHPHITNTKNQFNNIIISLLFAETSPNSPFAAQELSLLKMALNDERSERIQLQASEMSKTLTKLTPIYVPQPKDNRINELEKNLTKVKHVSCQRDNDFHFPL